MRWPLQKVDFGSMLNQLYVLDHHQMIYQPPIFNFLRPPSFYLRCSVFANSYDALDFNKVKFLNEKKGPGPPTCLIQGKRGFNKYSSCVLYQTHIGCL